MEAFNQSGDCMLFSGECTEGEPYRGQSHVPVKTYQVQRQASACVPMSFTLNNIDLSAPGACAFDGTGDQAMAKCAAGSTCKGLVEVTAATGGARFLAFQKPLRKDFHFLKERPGGDKYSCQRRLAGDHDDASPARILGTATKASTDGWCTANNDFVTMLPSNSDSSCAVHTSGACLWTGLSQAKANCERITACSGIVDNGGDEWVAYNGAEAFHIFYFDSSSTRSLASAQSGSMYDDCKRRLKVQRVNAPDVKVLPLLLGEPSVPTTVTTTNPTTSSRADSTTTTTSSSAVPATTTITSVPLREISAATRSRFLVVFLLVLTQLVARIW